MAATAAAVRTPYTVHTWASDTPRCMAATAASIGTAAFSASSAARHHSHAWRAVRVRGSKGCRRDIAARILGTRQSGANPQEEVGQTRAVD